MALRMSTLFLRTLRDDPADAEVASHRLLVRAESDGERLLAEVGQSLDATVLPEMYVQADPTLNALTVGMDRPIIVLSSGMVHHLDDDEMRFVIGHELGHALSGHAVYRTILMHLMRLAGTIGWIPVGGWALRAIIAGLMEWQRKSELSGDRAGLLCGQDPAA